MSVADERVQWHLTQVACHIGITYKHFTIHPDCLVVPAMMGADLVAADCLVSSHRQNHNKMCFLIILSCVFTADVMLCES